MQINSSVAVKSTLSILSFRANQPSRVGSRQRAVGRNLPTADCPLPTDKEAPDIHRNALMRAGFRTPCFAGAGKCRVAKQGDATHRLRAHFQAALTRATVHHRRSAKIAAPVGRALLGSPSGPDK